MSLCGHCDQFQVKKSFYLLWDNVHRDTYTEKLIYLPKLLGIRFTRLVDQSTYWLLYGIVVRVAGARQTMGHHLGKMLLDKARLQSWPQFTSVSLSYYHHHFTSPTFKDNQHAKMCQIT